MRFQLAKYPTLHAFAPLTTTYTSKSLWYHPLLHPWTQCTQTKEPISNHCPHIPCCCMTSQSYCLWVQQWERSYKENKDDGWNCEQATTYITNIAQEINDNRHKNKLIAQKYGPRDHMNFISWLQIQIILSATLFWDSAWGSTACDIMRIKSLLLFDFFTWNTSCFCHDIRWSCVLDLWFLMELWCWSNNHSITDWPQQAMDTRHFFNYDFDVHGMVIKATK